jgi:hypothetical protein
MFKTKQPMKLINSMACAVFVLLLLFPFQLYGDEVDTLKKELEEVKEELEEMDERLNQTELHTVTDKISLGFEFRTRYDSIHYDEIYYAPSWLREGFFNDFNEANYDIIMGAFATGDFTDFRDLMEGLGAIPPGTPVDQFQAMIQGMMTTPEGAQALLPVVGGFNGVSQAQAQALMAMMAGANIPADKYDTRNDSIFTNRLRLNMNSKFNNNLSFAGRLSMYKVFADSTGVKTMTGSLNDLTLDGNTSSRPNSDELRVERAYFNYKNDIGPVPVNVSFGRRPATDGSPLEYQNYSQVGGSPMATIINWQFDGASLSFGLEDVTGIPGASFKLCYGVGFESDWGNSYSLNGTSYVDDATFGGFIATLYDNDTTSAELNYAHAWDITDGFAGTVVMPFIPVKNSDGTYSFIPNTGGFISRVEAATNIGDFDLASLVIKTNMSDYLADIDFFFAPSWSHTDPSRISRNPYYELMGQGLLSTADANGNLESQDGYSIYTGIVLPSVYEGRLGLEYNWGSKYWFNMTGAEDSLVGSKLSARGQVYEAYYIQPVFKDNFFLRLGGRYYDYEYTGSGNPLGEPVKIDDLNALDTLFPVTDTAWNVYFSATIRM